MKKKDLIKKFDEMAELVDNLVGSLKETLEEMKQLHTDIENLPHDNDEIEEDEKD